MTKKTQQQTQSTQQSSHDLYYPDSNLFGYSFLQTLKKTKSDLYGRAEQLFNTIRGNLRDRSKKAPNVEYLLALAQHERAKEQKLIAELLPGQTLNLQDTGDYLAAINSLLNKKSIFDRNINRIANIKKVKGQNNNYKGGGAIDISTRFAGFLRSNFDQLDFKNITFENLKQTVKQSLIDLYTNVTRDDEKLSSTSAYQELADAIESSGVMVEKVMNLYFGTDVVSALRDNPRKKLTKDQATKYQSKFGGLMYYDHFKGSLFEYQHELMNDLMAESFAKAGINVDTLHTGTIGNQKADIINLINMTITADQLGEFMNQALAEGDPNEQSVRVRNADMWLKVRDFLNGQQGCVIEVTDKNYSLTSESFIKNKGFTAQSSFRADFLERFLFRMQMSQTQIGELMFVLANTGKQFISNDSDYEAAEIFLATYIGFFLFDDLQVSDLGKELSKDANTTYVHFMNLDGIFIPFSLFLSALYKAFIDITNSENYKDFANIEIKDEYKKTWKNNDTKLEESDWTSLYQEKLQETVIDAHFFGNFVNYIRKGYLNQSEI